MAQPTRRTFRVMNPVGSMGVENALTAVLQAVDQPVVLCSAEGVVQTVNPALEALLLDFPRVSLAPGTRFEAAWGPDVQPALRRCREVAALGQRAQAELSVADRAGQARVLVTRWQPFPGGGGMCLTLGHGGGSAENSTAVLRRALDAIAEGVVVADLDQRAIYTNRAFAQMAGGEPGQRLTMGHAIGGGDGNAELRQNVRRHLDAGQPFRGEIQGRDEAGSPYWHEIVVTPLVSEQGEVTHFVGVREDITKRKQIERSLEESRSRLQAVITTAMDGIVSFDADGRIVLINQAAASMFRLSEAEAVGQSVERWIPGVNEAARLLAAEGGDGTAASLHGRVGEIHGVRPDGEEFPLEVSVSQVQVSGRQLFTAILRDISARREAERVLQASQRRFKSIFEHSIDGILLMDDMGHYLDANPAACRMLGYPRAELVGLNIREVTVMAKGESFAERWERFLLEGTAEGEVALRRKDGSTVDVEYTSVAHILAGLHLTILRDTTERRLLQEQLLRQQRLDSVGRLASGLAHDLNNILTPILMVPGMLRGRLQDPASLNLLDLLEQGARRGAAIIDQLLTFAREMPGERKIQHLNTLAEAAVRLMKETFPRNIDIDLRPDPAAWPCLGDATQLQQLILNLGMNARDAMPQGGRLTLAVSNATVGSEEARLTPGAKPGPHVVLAVADSGRGIDPQYLERIFDPFFTTKPFGEGTGLGLSSALGIARNHGGFLTVRSRPGDGSTFRVYLPAAGVDAPNAERERRAADRAGARGEVVLVVDDEEDLRNVAREWLSHHGYDVICARDGESALAQLKAANHQVDLVLTDLSMPGMGGERLVALLRRRNPRLRIIVMSGRDPESPGPNGRPVVQAFLRKPFTGDELLRALAATRAPE